MQRPSWLWPPSSNPVSRTLVIGDPIVVLGEHGVLHDAALVISDGEVSWVGPRSDAPARDQFDQVLGSPEHAVLPGFINGHYHSEASLDRILFEHGIDRYNTRWHVQSGMPITEEALYDAVMTSLIACARGGQTGIVDMFYGNPRLPNFGADAAIQAYHDLGLRAGFGLCSRDDNVYVHAHDEELLCRIPRTIAEEVRRSTIGYAWPADDILDCFRRLADQWNVSGSRIRIIPSPDWTPACSDSLYRRCAQLADEHGVPMTSHVLESRYEMAASYKQHGKSAIRRLADLGILDHKLTCAHMVWADREELKLIADSNSIVAHNPVSNLRTGQGIAPVRELMDMGGRFVVGTDSLPFSSEDYLLDLRFGLLLQRRPRNLTDARIDSIALLEMMASAGAQALGQEDALGSLEPRKRADLVLLRRDRVLAPPGRAKSWNPIDALLDLADARDIEAVMVDGQIVVRNGEITRVDADAVIGRHMDEVERRERRLHSDGSLRREFIELPDLLDEHAVAIYHDQLLTEVRAGEVYNLVGQAKDVALEGPRQHS